MPCLVGAQSLYGEILISRVNTVYDGDTFRVDIDEYPAIVGKNMPIRINGIDTPEIKAKCALERDLAIKAKELTKKKLEAGKVIELRNIKRGKYFRIISDVYVDSVSLADELLDAELAVKYFGGKKQKNWCLSAN